MNWDYKNFKQFLPSKEALSPWLPSRNVTIAGAFLALFIGWLFWVPTTETFKLKSVEFNTRQVSQAEQGMAATDSDRDGLKDWEESLWHTDPRNPDTDGDGVTDNDEVKNGHSPTIAGPNDLLPKLSETLEVPQLPDYQEGQNLTEHIAKDFLIKYMAMKKKGLDPTKALPEMLGDSMFAQSYEDEYLISDLNLINDDSDSAIKKYVNNLATILNSHAAANEAPLLQEFSEKQDYTILKQLAPSIESYEKMVISLKNMSVPLKFSSAHLSLINLTANSKKALTALQNSEKDPSLALVGLSEYSKSVATFPEIATKITTALKSKNIIFNSRDPGYLFMW
jgi:hypothetical protein